MGRKSLKAKAAELMKNSREALLVLMDSTLYACSSSSSQQPHTMPPMTSTHHHTKRRKNKISRRTILRSQLTRSQWSQPTSGSCFKWSGRWRGRGRWAARGRDDGDGGGKLKTLGCHAGISLQIRTWQSTAGCSGFWMLAAKRNVLVISATRIKQSTDVVGLNMFFKLCRSNSRNRWWDVNVPQRSWSYNCRMYQFTRIQNVRHVLNRSHWALALEKLP